MLALPIEWIGSLHRTQGRDGARPEAVVIHIMEGTLAGTDAWFNDPVSRVSAHYGIGRFGVIHQYVSESDTAYHAGRVREPSWRLIKPGVNPNSYTVGIEHEGTVYSPWPAALYEASAALVRVICDRWSIPLDRDHVIGHREIYGLKLCPGGVVDFTRLISMARAMPASVSASDVVTNSGVVITRTNLNIRRLWPSSAADWLGSVPPGVPLAYTGFTTGESVAGNANWYRDPDGNYFWAGGTDHPDPGAIGG